MSFFTAAVRRRWLCWALLWLAPAASARADRLILRSLQIITDRTVTSFDQEGVLLDNQQRLGWHEIERGTITADRQAEFDRLLAELGEDLYRVRQRLTTADYAGLLPPAESLYPKYSGSTSDTAYLVTQAVMWGRIAVTRREEAVEPYLRCLEILRTRPAAAKGLPGERRLQFDPATGLSAELVPVWFQPDAAREALPNVFRRIAEMAKPRPEGAYAYYASLALASGDDAAATKVLSAMRSSQAALVDVRLILAAQREINAGKPGAAVAQLSEAQEKMQGTNRALAWYWLGIARLHDSAEDAQAEGMLQLLRIPALLGLRQPELSAAALYRVMESLAARGNPTGSVSVRRELLERYGQTYHAVRAREQNETEKTP